MWYKHRKRLNKRQKVFTTEPLKGDGKHSKSLMDRLKKTRVNPFSPCDL